MHAKLLNAEGKLKDVKVGISWTTFFFGFFVPLFRRDWMYFAIFLIVSIILSMFTSFAFVFDIVMAFFYNKLYTQNLIKKGYAPASPVDEDILKSKGYI